MQISICYKDYSTVVTTDIPSIVSTGASSCVTTDASPLVTNDIVQMICYATIADLKNLLCIKYNLENIMLYGFTQYPQDTAILKDCQFIEENELTIIGDKCKTMLKRPITMEYYLEGYELNNEMVNIIKKTSNTIRWDLYEEKDSDNLLYHIMNDNIPTDPDSILYQKMYFNFDRLLAHGTNNKFLNDAVQPVARTLILLYGSISKSNNPLMFKKFFEQFIPNSMCGIFRWLEQAVFLNLLDMVKIIYDTYLRVKDNEADVFIKYTLKHAILYHSVSTIEWCFQQINTLPIPKEKFVETSTIMLLVKHDDPHLLNLYIEHVLERRHEPIIRPDNNTLVDIFAIAYGAFYNRLFHGVNHYKLHKLHCNSSECMCNYNNYIDSISKLFCTMQFRFDSSSMLRTICSNYFDRIDRTYFCKQKINLGELIFTHRSYESLKVFLKQFNFQLIKTEDPTINLESQLKYNLVVGQWVEGLKLFTNFTPEEIIKCRTIIPKENPNIHLEMMEYILEHTDANLLTEYLANNSADNEEHKSSDAKNKPSLIPKQGKKTFCKWGAKCQFNKENRCNFVHPIKKCKWGQNCEFNKKRVCHFLHE